MKITKHTRLVMKTKSQRYITNLGQTPLIAWPAAPSQLQSHCMKINSLFRTLPSRLTMPLLLLLLVISALASGFSAQAAGKGNGGNVGGDLSGWIFTQVEVDDNYRGGSLANGLVNDGNPYVHGVDRVEALIGRNFSILMDFNKQPNKPSIRKLKFPSGLVVSYSIATVSSLGCLPSGTLTPPTGPAPLIANPSKLAVDAELSFAGQDHDDTPVGCARHVNCRLTMKDDNGRTWIVYFGSRLSAGGNSWAPCGSCLTVERLPNLGGNNPGISQWEFYTEPLDFDGDSTANEHIGYLFRDNNPPNAPTEFWGAVNLPFSGIIESLTLEPVPTTSCSDFADSGTCG